MSNYEFYDMYVNYFFCSSHSFSRFSKVQNVTREIKCFLFFIGLTDRGEGRSWLIAILKQKNHPTWNSLSYFEVLKNLNFFPLKIKTKHSWMINIKFLNYKVEILKWKHLWNEKNKIKIALMWIICYLLNFVNLIKNVKSIIVLLNSEVRSRISCH